jgi:phage/plasmid-like protein (TIGR03299 family)
MAHEFTSGLLLNNTPAWHGLGEVLEGTMPAPDAFRRAGALFPVEKLQLWAGDLNNPELLDAIALAADRPFSSPQERGEVIHQAVQQHLIDMADNRVAIWRPDTRKVLGTASPGYQVIPNQRLLDFASALREECDMDAVVVLRKGARVAFTAKIRGTDKDVLPGDTINLNFVGYLGHDGKTGLGAMLTPIRVVCANTLGYAMADADRNNKHLRIRHNAFEISQIDSLIEQIDLGRQQLPTVVTEMQMLQSKTVTYDGFRNYLERVYSLPPVMLPNGDTRPASVEDMPRRWAQLKEAWNYGLGHDIPGVANTAWAAFNAVTQVESSTKTAGAGLRRTHSALFGTGKGVIQRARELAAVL